MTNKLMTRDEMQAMMRDYIHALGNAAVAVYNGEQRHMELRPSTAEVAAAIARLYDRLELAEAQLALLVRAELHARLSPNNPDALTPEAWAMLLDLIENPPEPSEWLRKAMETGRNKR